ncbi:unnamed protein product [Amoebophrya sp. A25]|nr:unnamed protein product [Amoebophrya sp. A25]|eukprot:GSA25T00004175001.1
MRVLALRRAEHLFYQYAVEEMRANAKSGRCGERQRAGTYNERGEQHPVGRAVLCQEDIASFQWEDTVATSPDLSHQEDRPGGAAPSRMDEAPKLLEWVASLFLDLQTQENEKSAISMALRSERYEDASEKNGSSPRSKEFDLCRSPACVDVLRFCPSSFRTQRQEFVIDAILQGRSDIAACAPRHIRLGERFAFLASVYGPTLGFLPTFRDFSPVVSFCLAHDFRQVRWVPLRSCWSVHDTDAELGEYNARGVRLQDGLTPGDFVYKVLEMRSPLMLKYCSSDFRDNPAMCCSAYLMNPNDVSHRLHTDRSFVLEQLETYIRDADHGGYSNIVGYTFSHETESEILTLFADDQEIIDKAREAARRRAEVEAAGGPSLLYDMPDLEKRGVIRFWCYPPHEQRVHTSSVDDSETSGSLSEDQASQADSFYSACSVDT